MIKILKTKIHRATISEANLDYEGSITLPLELLEASGIKEYEAVAVWDITNGARFETYVIEEDAGSGAIGLYGAAAHLGKAGDIVIILSYALMEEPEAKGLKVKTVRVNKKNKLLK